MTLWWPAGPHDDLEVVLLTSESSALAAIAALRLAPPPADLYALPSVAAPRDAEPRLAHMIAGELACAGAKQVWVALDAELERRRLVVALRRYDVGAFLVAMPDGKPLASVLAAAERPGERVADLFFELRRRP